MIIPFIPLYVRTTSGSWWRQVQTEKLIKERMFYKIYGIQTSAYVNSFNGLCPIDATNT